MSNFVLKCQASEIITANNCVGGPETIEASRHFEIIHCQLVSQWGEVYWCETKGSDATKSSVVGKKARGQKKAKYERPFCKEQYLAEHGGRPLVERLGQKPPGFSP